MNAVIINQFIIAFNEVLEMIGLQVIKKNKTLLIKDKIEKQQAAVLIEIIGKYGGKCFITSTIESLLQLTGEMNFETFTEVNDLVLSTFSELGNMVSGRATTLLSQNKILCDVTPPLVFVDEDLLIETNKYSYIRVPFETQNGLFNLNLSVQ